MKEGDKITTSPVMVLNGCNGTIYLYNDKIIINRKGLIAKLDHGWTKGDKTIYLNQITAIELKTACFRRGYIQFTLPGGIEQTKGGVGKENRHDENTVEFFHTENNTAQKLKTEIEKLKVNYSQPMKLMSKIVDSIQTNKSRAIAAELTVIIPAYNEETSVAETVRSVLEQTYPPARVIVVDDGSTDRTGELASQAGAEVIKPPKNTGSKADAQNYALKLTDTKYCMAIDADTTLAPDGIEKLILPLENEEVAACCGFVIPRFVNTIWERGRYIEYLLSFTFYKPTQDFYGKPTISSGCFSAYNTEKLKEMGGWSERTRAEDMDLTWSFYEAGYKVRFIPEAVCYPIEPHNLDFMGKQLKRWSHGFVQNVQLHWGKILILPLLSSFVGISMWDAIIASIAMILLPILAIFLKSPFLLLAYVYDFPFILCPVMIKAIPRGEGFKALISIPCFFILRIVNAMFMLEAVWTEYILKKPLLVYEKGH